MKPSQGYGESTKSPRDSQHDHERGCREQGHLPDDVRGVVELVVTSEGGVGATMNINTELKLPNDICLANCALHNKQCQHILNFLRSFP